MLDIARVYRGFAGYRASTGCTLADQAQGKVAMPPDTPSRGEIWIDPNDRVAKVWDGVSWQQIRSTHSGRVMDETDLRLTPPREVKTPARKCNYCGVQTHSSSEHCPNCAAALPSADRNHLEHTREITKYSFGSASGVVGPAGCQGVSGVVGPAGDLGIESGGPG